MRRALLIGCCTALVACKPHTVSREVIVLLGLLQLVEAVLLFLFCRQHHRGVAADRCGAVRADRRGPVAEEAALTGAGSAAPSSNRASVK